MPSEKTNNTKNNTKKGVNKSKKQNQSKKIKNQKGSGLADAYSSDDYKDVSAFDFAKFRSDDSKLSRNNPPSFPPCTIL